MNKKGMDTAFILQLLFWLVVIVIVFFFIRSQIVGPGSEVTGPIDNLLK